MKFKRLQRKTVLAPDEAARRKALRKKYQDRPTPEELLASGDYTEPISLGIYLKIKQLLHQLKEARKQAKLSLTEVARETNIDKGYLSKLENFQQPNTTLATVYRIAEAVGLEIQMKPKRSTRRSSKPSRNLEARVARPKA